MCLSQEPENQQRIPDYLTIAKVLPFLTLMTTGSLLKEE